MATRDGGGRDEAVKTARSAPTVAKGEVAVGIMASSPSTVRAWRAMGEKAKQEGEWPPARRWQRKRRRSALRRSQPARRERRSGCSRSDDELEREEHSWGKEARARTAAEERRATAATAATSSLSLRPAARAPRPPVALTLLFAKLPHAAFSRRRHALSSRRACAATRHRFFLLLDARRLNRRSLPRHPLFRCAAPAAPSRPRRFAHSASCRPLAVFLLLRWPPSPRREERREEERKRGEGG